MADWLKKYQTGGRVHPKFVNKNVQKRLEELYNPIYKKIMTNVPEGLEFYTLPNSTMSALQVINPGVGGKYLNITPSGKDRNPPPMDNILEEMQKKILNLPDKEIKRLLKVHWGSLSIPQAMIVKPDNVGYLEAYKYLKHIRKLSKEGYTFEKGGTIPIAKTKEQQYEGLNNKTYNEMIFPLVGMNLFRGLDSGQPVELVDQTGRKEILNGPNDTTFMKGEVREKRLQSGGSITPVMDIINNIIKPTVTREESEDLQTYKDIQREKQRQFEEAKTKYMAELRQSRRDGRRRILQDNSFHINDPREIVKVTGRPINPKRDLKTGNYSEPLVDSIINSAITQGVDPYLALSVGMQESGLGTINDLGSGESPNIGRVLYLGDKAPIPTYIGLLKDKIDLAKEHGVTDEAKQIQYYNGTGTITKNDSGLKSLYGVPIPETGINMSENPLYGKQVLDIKNNILMKNPNVVRKVDSITNVRRGTNGQLASMGNGGWLLKYKN